MISKTSNGTSAVPSRNALRALRNIALAGSTLGTFCAAAAITYDIHRRIRVAERIVENKRTLHASAPQYDATAAARRLGKMMEAAEAGEFMGIASLKDDELRPRRKKTADVEGQGKTHNGLPDSNDVVEDHNDPTRSNSFLDSLGLRLHPTVLDDKKEKQLNPEPFPSEMRINSFDQHKFNNIRQQSDSEQDSSTALPIRPFQTHALSLAKEMIAFLDQGRAIEAAQLFIDAYTEEGISYIILDLVEETFYMNCKQQNVFIARSVFMRLDQLNRVTPTMWATLMLALAKKGCIESVATLYTDYIGRFQLPPVLVDIVIRCLVESQRLTAAKKLLFENIRIDRNCGLCGAFLAGIWRKTRSIELINGQLAKILNILPRIGKRPSEKLFNPVLKAYIEFGRLTDAEAMVNDMATKHNIRIVCRTKGLLVFGKALNCDWEGVRQGLQEMHDSGMTRNTRDFIQIFDRIFLEYWVSHSGVETRDFVFYYVDKFGIQPDRVLYKHILEAFVEKGDPNMIHEFSTMIHERGWKIPFSDKEFLEILRLRRLALEESPVGFWQMLQAARSKYGSAATSNRVLGYDQRSLPSTDVNKMPFTGAPLPWYERSIEQGLTAPRRADQYQKLTKQMAYSIQVGRIPEALASFAIAKRAGFCMSQPHIELAVIATLLEYGLHAAQRFLETESAVVQGLFKTYPELFDQIAEGVPEEELVQTAVFRFYQLSESTKYMKVRHHIAVTTSRRLMLANKPDLALDLLISVYMSRYRRELDFSGVCMKMFIRAFAKLNQLQGIRWCILTGLTRTTAVSHEFIAEVRLVLAGLRRTLSATDAPKLEYLEQISDMLEKGQSDSGTWKVHTNPHLKRSSRHKLRRANDEKLLFRKADIVRTIESWDEEYELEAALGRTDSHPRSTEWDESRLLKEEIMYGDL